MGWLFCGRTAVVCGFVFALCLSSRGISEESRCAATLAEMGLEEPGPKAYAPIEMVRATEAKLVYLNAELLRRDFPRLRDLDDAAIGQFVTEHFGFVTRYVNDNREVHHSGVAVDERDRRGAVVPATYGRAVVMEAREGGVTVDLKGTGVTYVSKGHDGSVQLAPGSVKFERTASHQNGLASLPEGLYEIAAGETLEVAARDDSGKRVANRVYFELDLGAELFVHNDAGEIVRRERAVAIGRQPHRRLYRAGEEGAALARRQFLARNARLFWSGLFHGSLNRYNAEDEAYLDYGTFTGVPREAYRLTSMAFVPYGLSDFYGLFGEWSEGQVASEKSRKLTPFYPRSWGVFLANIGVALGLSDDGVWQLAERSWEIGEEDLHQVLKAIQSGKPERSRWDPTGKTKSVMDLIEIQEWGISGNETVADLLDTTEIYRELLSAAAAGGSPSEARYLRLIEKAVRGFDSRAAARLARGLARVESVLRKSYQSEQLRSAAERLGNRRLGEALVRPRLNAETREAAEAVSRGSDARSFIRKWVGRLGVGSESRVSLGSEAVERWARSGGVSAMLGRFQSGAADRDMWFLVPPAAGVHDETYRRVQDTTIGILWRDTRPAGEQFGHSYIRVGDEIFDLQVAKIEQDGFSRMLRNRFFYDFQMLGRSGNTPYYEVLFAISPQTRDELLRYLRDRAAGKATVAGNVVTPYFEVSGKGEEWDGIVRENCGAFATSFSRPRWHKDYPLLARVATETGLSQPMDGATVALQTLFYKEACPLALVAWGSSGLRRDPEQAMRVVSFTGWPHHIDKLTQIPIAPLRPRHRDSAARVREWAESQDLAGFQATALPALSKSGELLNEPFRFNMVRLEPAAIPRFTDEIASRRVGIWWRWEPGGQYGHSWISVGDTLYDQGFGNYSSQPLGDFLRKEERDGFRLNGQSTFFVSLLVDIDAKDADTLKRFFDARLAGKKSDGTELPRPGYAWEQPLVDGEVTGERCGMFNTSFGNRGWQQLFPELALDEVAKRYGLRYSDGSLFVLHNWFYRSTAARDLFVIGPDEHVRRQGFAGWDLPVDSLPPAVRETMRGAWQIVDRTGY